MASATSDASAPARAAASACRTRSRRRCFLLYLLKLGGRTKRGDPGLAPPITTLSASTAPEVSTSRVKRFFLLLGRSPPSPPPPPSSAPAPPSAAAACAACSVCSASKKLLLVPAPAPAPSFLPLLPPAARFSPFASALSAGLYPAFNAFFRPPLLWPIFGGEGPPSDGRPPFSIRSL